MQNIRLQTRQNLQELSSQRKEKPIDGKEKPIDGKAKRTYVTKA